MSRHKLYNTPGFYGARCTWIIEEMGVQEDFEIVPYNPYHVSASQKQWYMENCHPQGLVPSMILKDGTVMIESAAICLYLADLYQQCLPEPDEKPSFYSMIFFAIGTADASLKILYTQWFKVAEDQRDPDQIKTHLPRLKVFLDTLEKHMQNKQFICGSKFTVADVIVGYSIEYALLVEEHTNFLQKCPAVRDYQKRLASRPAYKTGFGGIKHSFVGGKPV